MTAALPNPTRRVRIDDVELCVHDAGQGPPLLFVHGFPLSHAMWAGQLGPLAASHRVIAPDLRGFGASDVTPGVVSMDRLADDLAALLDALQVREPVVFVGLSMGGYVGWSFVRRHAARLAALVLCDTRAAADAPEAQAQRRKMARHVLEHGTAALAEAMLPRLVSPATAAARPELVELLRGMIAAAPPAGVAAAQEGMAAREDATALLPSIGVPTLLVVGSEDVISPAAEMAAMAERVPGARLVVVPGAGHMAPLEAPATVNAALAEFLAGLGPAGRR